MLRGYGIEETFGKPSKSVFLECFSNVSSFVSQAAYAEDTNLRLGRNFASATMFRRLRRP